MKSAPEGLIVPAGRGRYGLSLVSLVMVALMTLAATSCSELTDGFAILAANRHFQEGRIHDAIAGYHQLGPTAMDDLVAYNLANAFMALGEFTSAEPLFNKAASSLSPSVAAAAWFNLGVAFYDRGDFPGAVAAFRSSLEARPSDREVSRAYELALNASRAVQSISDREQARFQAAKAGGDQAMFGLAMPAPRPFFVPGVGPGDGGIDH
jgi:tetratricopeptide (TPR) repeat protein